MSEGKLIIEVYEYTGEDAAAPAFEFIPCPLEKCFKHNRATLKEILQRSLVANPEKLKDILRIVEEAGFDQIDVAYNKPTNSLEPCIELTNIVQVSMADADASRKKKKRQNNIILYGKYRLSDGTEITKLRDAQRLSLFYSSQPETIDGTDYLSEEETSDAQKEICLNITYLQD